MLALHEAADGWLARVRVPGGRLSAAQLDVLAAAAEELGNGFVDLTARANLQLRGLEKHGGEGLARRLRPVGLLPSLAHDRVRNVLAGPLAGRAPGALADVDDIVALLDARVCASTVLDELPGRFCFLVDDGTGTGSELLPDITVVALDAGGFGVSLDGQPLPITAEAHVAVTLAVDAALAFLDVRGDAWRLSEVPGGAPAVAAQLGLRIVGAKRPLRRAPALAPGILTQHDGRVAVTALAPLGQLSPALLRELATLGPDLRLSAQRTVTLVDLDPQVGGPASAAMQRAGLVVDGASGWFGLTACAGTGHCANALADVRAAAARRALVRAPGAPAEHWAACDRRCGETGSTAVAVAVQRPGAVAVRYGTRTSVEPTLYAARERVQAEYVR